MTSSRRPTSGRITNGHLEESQAMCLPDASLLARELLYATRNRLAAPHYTDITLLTSDGKRVLGMKNVLALRIPTMRRLIRDLGNHEEVSHIEFEVHVEDKVLLEVIHFIYIDDCPSLRKIREKKTRLLKCEEIRHIIKISKAAEYMRIGTLISRCLSAVAVLLRCQPHLACAVVQELDTVDTEGSWVHEMQMTAARTAAASPKAVFFGSHGENCDESNAVLHLNFEAVSTNISDVMVCGDTDQHILFQALLVWASEGRALRNLPVRLSASSSVQIMVDVASMNLSETKLIQAKDMAEKLNPEQFEPLFLSNVVADSGLFDKTRLHATYRTVMLRLDARVRDVLGSRNDEHT